MGNRESEEGTRKPARGSPRSVVVTRGCGPMRKVRAGEEREVYSCVTVPSLAATHCPLDAPVCIDPRGLYRVTCLRESEVT